MNLDDDKTFQKTLPKLRVAPVPSTTLEKRIAALGEKRRPSRVLAMAVGGLAVAGALAGLFLVPRIALARALEEAQKGLQSERLHTRMTWFVGKKKSVKETWYASGKLRSDFLSSHEHLVEIVEKDRRWLYYPHLEIATWQHNADTIKWIAAAESEARNATEAGLRLLRREPGVVDEGEVVLEGRRFRRLTQTTTQKEGLLRGEVRSESLVDLQERRLARVELQMHGSGGWKTRVRLEYYAGSQTPEGFFEPTFPRAKIYNLDAFGAEIGRRFARPLAVKKFASRTIALRDVQVNSEGDIFVLFTDGARENKPHKEASTLDIPTDSLRTKYTGTAGAMEPYMEMSKGKERGLTVDGDRMHGTCFTLAKPLVGKWRPRTLQIPIHFNEQVGKKYYTRSANFTVPIARPRAALLPDYAEALQILSLAGGEKERFETDRDRDRQVAAWNDRRWADLLTLTERSLTRYPDEFYARLYNVQALRHLGRLVEARQVLNTLLPEAGFNQKEADDENKALSHAEHGKPDDES
ncbi:hypothetical protein [Armatimonas sp.]|uniref:hypothetical protein n=1 Tax=Armatimonas sp. TaxID=1872638 RepID=UPI00374D66AD